MQLREKGSKKDAEPITMGWDEAQSAIAAGTHVVYDSDDDKKPAAAPAAKDDDKK